MTTPKLDMEQARAICEAAPARIEMVSTGNGHLGYGCSDEDVSSEAEAFYEFAHKALPAAILRVEELEAIIAANLPHPNGPAATTPGDPDAWNAAMFNLGELRTLSSTQAARILELEQECERLRGLVEEALELARYLCSDEDHERYREDATAIRKATTARIAESKKDEQI